jgi:hypothetical protein
MSIDPNDHGKKVIRPEAFETDFPDTELPLSVDDSGIPILDEVVEPASELDEESGLIAPSPFAPAGFGLNLPNQKELLSALREQLKLQARKDLEEIARQAAATVALRFTEELERVIQDELEQALEERLNQLADRLLSRPEDN